MVNITSKEAQAALNDIQRFTDKTQSIIKLWLGLSSLQIGLLWITITMFDYIVAGVWLQLRLYIILGFAVTLMTISGYCLVPHYFWFWSAIFAGLPLVVVGVYWLRQR